MTFSKDHIGGLLLLSIFAFYGLQTQSIDLLPIQQSAVLTARSLPYTFTLLGIAGAVWLLLGPGDSDRPAFKGLRWGRFFLFLLLMSVYGLALRRQASC